MSILAQMRSKVVNSEKRRIILPESHDERILQAAFFLKQNNIATPILVGDSDKLVKDIKSAGNRVSDYEIIDPGVVVIDAYVQEFLSLRKNKSISEEDVMEAVQDPLTLASLVLRRNEVDGLVAGAVYRTADTIRAAIRIIGLASNTTLASSCFLMILEHLPFGRNVVFADCALVIKPDAEQLTDIAMSAVSSASLLEVEEPKVAMLSFSTQGSARHKEVDKVCQATQKLRTRCPGLLVDGEVQIDAAIVPEIAKRKLHDSLCNGQADVLIFPDLNSGNIGYKLAQRIGGAHAIGPLLQGLSRPVHDLSRGCSVDDVVNVATITAMQAQ